MMSLHRPGPLAEEYYLAQVAGGIEDYYSEEREAPGHWLSRSAELLGMEGTVDGNELRAVLSGRDPDTGAALHHAANRSTPGWDLTFRSPKSVSILWGLGDRRIAAHVRDAHQASVVAAVGYLERTAGFSRTGKNGIHRVEATAFLAAGFDHRTSRDGDPHLHTHVLVSNSVRCADGRMGSVERSRGREGCAADAACWPSSTVGCPRFDSLRIDGSTTRPSWMPSTGFAAVTSTRRCRPSSITTTPSAPTPMQYAKRWSTTGGTTSATGPRR